MPGPNFVFHLLKSGVSSFAKYITQCHCVADKQEMHLFVYLKAEFVIKAKVFLSVSSIQVWQEKIVL